MRVSAPGVVALAAGKAAISSSRPTKLLPNRRSSTKEGRCASLESIPASHGRAMQS
jgi:hypothetical protein